MSDIVWRLDEAEAVALLDVLTDTLEILDLEDNDADYVRIQKWAGELGDLLQQLRTYEESLQPPLT